MSKYRLSKKSIETLSLCDLCAKNIKDCSAMKDILEKMFSIILKSLIRKTEVSIIKT